MKLKDLDYLINTNQLVSITSDYGDILYQGQWLNLVIYRDLNVIVISSLNNVLSIIVKE